ncbi:AAA domain-containing protein [Corynebacterium sp. p3-SID1056]|uniref:AAA domain-containing protein n=1 Tax=Corynebacterium sp. p3-SID1056 TaxID=2916092 RepID=UPI0021A3B980|nr:AAA domain-containing protein [Corynebacterium sp. p3-SID1056]MCT2338230.1 AAA domain-containing protein [Corynebacterium sp. p3-SID1056]
MQSNADKASRLFLYLSALERRKEKPVLTTASYQKNGGKVLRLEQLRTFAEQTQMVFLCQQLQEAMELDPSHAIGELDGGNVLAIFKRPAPQTAPEVPEILESAITETIDDPHTEPELLESEDDAPHSIEVTNAFADWIQVWRTWSRLSKYGLAYQQVFEIQTSVNQQSDEFEFVLGLGNLAWKLEKSTIDRPLFTIGLDISLDKQSGDIRLALSEDDLRMEFEAVPPQKLEDGTFLSDTKEQLAGTEGDPLDEETFAELGHVTTNGLDTNATYLPTWHRQQPKDVPVIAWQPTIIMRKRQRTGLASAFKRIAERIEESGEVPAGLAPLVDPYAPSQVSTDPTPGAVFESNGEIFTPLPLNDKQKQVLQRVDSHAQTIVQGPPGTGKTHMAAAMLSHFLAQGLRVLVTAQADRALYELRGKLPAEIQELAVSVISSNQSDLSDLRVAVETINHRSTHFDEYESQRDIVSLEQRLNALREKRTQLLRDWSAAMEAENTPLDIPGYELRPSKAITKWSSEKLKFDWILSFDELSLTKPFPLSTEEIEEWFSLLDSEELSAHRVSPLGDTFNFNDLPTVEEVEELHLEEEGIVQDRLEAEAAVPESEISAWNTLAPAAQSGVLRKIQELDEQVSKVKTAPFPWADDLYAAVRAGSLAKERQLLEKLRNDLKNAHAFDERLSALKHISGKGPIDRFMPAARSLQGFLDAGGSIKVKADGMPKTGLFTNSIVKEAMPFFENVLVNGVPPTTSADITLYQTYVEFQWALEPMHSAWHYSAPPSNSSPRDILLFWDNTLAEYSASLEEAERIVSRVEWLNRYGFEVALEELPSLKSRLELLNTHTQRISLAEEQSQRMRSAICSLTTAKGKLGPLHWMGPMEDALGLRDAHAFSESLKMAHANVALSSKLRRRDSLTERATDWSSNLAGKVVDHADQDFWRDRVRMAESARCWAQMGELVSQRHAPNLNELSDSVEAVDTQITRTLSALAAERAWAKAANPERIDQSMRVKLIAYSQSVKRLGKGTGKYADQKRRDVRKNLEACQSAVPVWIMPIYKVVEQFGLEENIFDVVIVDEASQSGVDALFLQYLAPRIVVIGDDKQVSPTSFANEQEIRKLARQYLSDFDRVDTWTDPARSLFDEANMRYGGRITLEEHRRCVPEIIEFSNRYIYEPENISLKPVRAIEPERLAPFKITRTPNAFETESGSKRVNTAEADTLVSKVLEVLEDPAYAGKTLGVISLLSEPGQAQYIQARLLEKLAPEIWEERDLKVGKPAEFQGAERDVIFLSMVQPSSPDSRISVLTTSTFLQRYNVAVSRAKDQVWLFHSVGFEELNPEDIRAKLLQYAYEVAQAQPESKVSELVSNDERVEPFDSLFEQRVYNRIVERGYQVIPQYRAFGYRLDLVVVGAEGRLAVECDGDFWHGDQQALADQQRQRELERLGWTFVRFFESDFYLDPDTQMQKVWDALDELGIYPASREISFDPSKNVEIIEAVFADDAPIELETASAQVLNSEEDIADIEAAPEPENPDPIEPEESSEPTVATSLPARIESEESSTPEADVASPSERETPTSTSVGVPPQIETRDSEPNRVRLELNKRPTSGKPSNRWQDAAPIDQANATETGTTGDTHTPLSSAAPNRGIVHRTGGNTPVTLASAPMRAAGPYESFTGTTVPVHSATPQELKRGLLEILEVEGPMLASYLFSRYVKASGDSRVTKKVTSRLNPILSMLRNSGEVEMDDPLNTRGFKEKTFRLPQQEMVNLRERGPRRIHDIPPMELRAHVLKAFYRVGTTDREAVMREALRLLDLKRLPSLTEERLQPHYESVMETEGRS